MNALQTLIALVSHWHGSDDQIRTHRTFPAPAGLPSLSSQVLLEV